MGGVTKLFLSYKSIADRLKTLKGRYRCSIIKFIFFITMSNALSHDQLNEDQLSDLFNPYESSFDAVKNISYAPETLQHTPIKDHLGWAVQLNIAFDNYMKTLTKEDKDDYTKMDEWEFFDEFKWGVLDEFLSLTKKGEDYEKVGGFSDADIKSIDAICLPIVVRCFAQIYKESLTR